MILVDQFLQEHKKEKAERTHLSKKLCLAPLGTDSLDMVNFETQIEYLIHWGFLFPESRRERQVNSSQSLLPSHWLEHE